MADSPARQLADTFEAGLAKADPTVFSSGDLTNGGADDLTTFTIASGLSGGQKIQLWIAGFSTASANKGPIIRIGPTGGIVSTGYVGWGQASGTSIAALANSTAFKIANDANIDAATISDYLVTLQHIGGNKWSCRNHGGYATTHALFGVGYLALSGPLTQLLITTEATAASMDGGTIEGAYWT